MWHFMPLWFAEAVMSDKHDYRRCDGPVISILVSRAHFRHDHNIASIPESFESHESHVHKVFLKNHSAEWHLNAAKS